MNAKADEYNRVEGTQDVFTSTMNIVRGGANAMAAAIEYEAEMDPNIELLEAKIDHVAADVSEVKAELRDVRAKQETDTRELRRDISELRDRTDAKIDGLRDNVAALGVKLESSLRKMTIGWFLSLGAILGVMAKGFHWI